MNASSTWLSSGSGGSPPSSCALRIAEASAQVQAGDVVLGLASSGGALTGKLSGAQGEIELQDGKIDGNNVSWKANITSPMALTLEFSATVDGDKMSGNVKLGAFGNASFTGTRA